MVECNQVGLQFRRRQMIGAPSSGSRSRGGEFWALQDVSFTVMPGEVFGIIGRNGAGKSTLLRVISGVYTPDKGSVRVRGRVGALLSLGSGFMNQLSGRENIMVQGLTQGLTPAEIRAKEEAIIEYAELGDFIDEPVYTYSSGMRARLGFAIATVIEADILLVDEILGVGDRDFAVKSRQTIMNMIRDGRTVILVSHNLSTITQLCDRVLWLDKGRVMDIGEPEAVVSRYNAS
ncbi:MAG: hypothetical protein CWE10_13960 [Symbiobacterium thermophilum]|uniref:ABC transporter domain-containing protein n=1 Tax=Symbiobacterium thermophilum TaxID=2734 RepID=A0A953IA79_SYMTR|nr:hypothetical protein [Symbiobacterium thermophilum]